MPSPALSASSVLPDLDQLLASMSVVRLPMRVRFRGVLEREVALFEGPAGWGEFAPFLEYAPPEASRWLAAAIEAAWVGWPSAVRTQVAVNATVPAVSPGEVGSVLANFDGCRTAKVKVAEPGQSLVDDLARVAEVRALMGPDAAVRVDANGGWDVDQATDALGALSVHRLEYAEQPCASVEDLARVRIALARRGIDVQVAADESIRKVEDPLRVVALEAADIIVVKVAPLGGVGAALDIAQRCGLPTVVSSALDSSVGIAAGVALAAALPELPHACGLGTASLLARDVCDASLVPRSGMLPVGRVSPSRARLTELTIAEERIDWWRDRVSRCHAVLAQRSA